MSKAGIVRSLIEQALSLGFRIRTVALDSGFHSVGAARCISRFKFISAVPVGDVKAGIRGEFDGRHGTRGKRPAADEQVDFRPIVSRRRAGLEPAGHRRRGPEYVARATNLELPGRDVLRLYDRIRAPIETSYRDIKSFLLFTSSTKRIFRLFAFLLAALIYSFSTLFRGSLRREEFRLLPALVLIRGMVEVEIEPFGGDNNVSHDPYLRDPYLRR